jgi:hypothetical protein
LIVSWLVFPLVLAALSFGLGLLFERLAGIRLPGVLLPPIGFAALIVVAEFATLTDATAELATPLAIVLAVAGFVVSPRRSERRLDGWALACAVGVFAVFAAPTALSGDATFAGYARLDDTATWFAVTDRVMTHGRDLSGIPPSTYRIVLGDVLGAGYPIGAFLPAGVGRAIVGEDIAWAFQPYLAFLAALLALGLYYIAQALVDRRWIAASIAFFSAQAALLFGYSLWGGVKELAAAAILPLIAAAAPVALEHRGKVAGLAPLALAGGAMVGILSLGGAVWLVPAVAGLLIAGLRFKGRAFTLRQAGAFAVLAAAFALPAITAANVFVEPARNVLTSQAELGLLFHSLSPLQIFGIWPTGDFRVTPRDLAIADVLIAITAFGALSSLCWAWRRKAWSLLGYVAAAALGCAMVSLLGSPWVDGKAFAIVSPAFVLAGLCGVVSLLAGRLRAVSLLAGLAIAAGVVWSNVLAYQDVNLAPRDRLEEIADIGEQIKGQGPTLFAQYDPYAGRHFLRDAAPDVPFDTRARPLDMQTLSLSELYADIDAFQPASVLAYRTIVLPRSPVASRPPLPYRRTQKLRYYEIWQRPRALPETVSAQLPLGGLLNASAVPSCKDVLRLAQFAGPGGRLAAARAPTPAMVLLGRATRPKKWHAGASDLAKVRPFGPGTLQASFKVDRAGRYDAWLGGSFRSAVHISIDGKQLKSARGVLNWPEAFFPLGTLALSPGPHRVALRYDGADLHPGSGGNPLPLGPVGFTPVNAPRPVESVPARSARRLCGQALDWVEAIGGSTPSFGQGGNF